jgi:nitroreductase
VDTATAIRTKRMIRRFDGRPLDPDHLRRILDAGRHAASSKNLQRWTFVVVTDRGRLRELAETGRFAGHLAGAAAAVALVTPDGDGSGPPSVMWDLGIAAGNMMLAAYEPERCRSILGYPADHRCAFILSFGYPADTADLTRPPKSGGRKSLEEIVRSERW